MPARVCAFEGKRRSLPMIRCQGWGRRRKWRCRVVRSCCAFRVGSRAVRSVSRIAILLRQNGGEDLTGATSASCNGCTRHGPHCVTCVIFIIATGLGTGSVTAPFSPFQGPLTAQPTAPICMAAAQRALAVHHCSIVMRQTSGQNLLICGRVFSRAVVISVG